jgi:hypothetical protein
MQPLELAKAPDVRRWAIIIWPAFLSACLLEALVFAIIDPGEIHWPGHLGQATRQGVYTVAFFSFWLIGIACSALVLWLARAEPPHLDWVNGKAAD